jgi:hypothetical protein
MMSLPELKVSGEFWSEVNELPVVAALEQAFPQGQHLADAIADIFHDVDCGLRFFDAGQRTEAIWQWGFQFATHWGEHATSAIRALHCWLASEEQDLLASLPDR